MQNCEEPVTTFEITSAAVVGKVETYHYPLQVSNVAIAINMYATALIM